MDEKILEEETRVKSDNIDTDEYEEILEKECGCGCGKKSCRCGKNDCEFAGDFMNGYVPLGHSISFLEDESDADELEAAADNYIGNYKTDIDELYTMIPEDEEEEGFNESGS